MAIPSRHAMIVGFLLLLGTVPPVQADPPAKSPPPPADELLAWTGTNLKTIRACFMSMDTDHVILRDEGGKILRVSLENLLPASKRQAIEESRKLAERLIDPVRRMAFVVIKRGRFTMGSPQEEAGRLSSLEEQPVAVRTALPADGPVKDWEPLRGVGISRDFWLKETEVTWSEWCLVRDRAQAYGYTDLAVGRNGYAGDDSGNHPVTEITWWDAIKWCNAKSQIEGKTPVYLSTDAGAKGTVLKTGTPVPQVRWDADGYRLPTEAEWEYACRERKDAGNDAFHSGPISSSGVVPPDERLGKVAWYAGNSKGNTHPVKGRDANRLGLHDMHGNVAEWCWDWVDLLETTDVKDPKGPEKGFFQSFRGGSWADPARCCRSAYRGSLSPICASSFLVGFRPACGADPSSAGKAASDLARPERKPAPSAPVR